SNFWAALLDPVTRVPVVIAHEHSWSFEGEPLRRFIDRNVIARRADAIVAVSDEDRRRMIEIEHIPPGKIRTIPNGIPPLRAAGTDIRSELGIPAGAPLIEYMAAGKAAVATRVGGRPALVEEGVTGLLVPPRDPEALAAAIGELLRDPGRRAAMGERGRERQRQDYDQDVMVRRFETLY